MEQKIAIAVDDSVNALEAVHYGALMSNVMPQLKFVLLHIQPALSQYLTEEAQWKQKARTALEEALRKNEAKSQEILENATQRLIHKGVAENRVERLTFPRERGVADDILALSQTKSYDAVLVARRGTSYLREWVMGSVTANLVEHAKDIPVWMVDGQVTSDKVLLAADGSTASLRALDHLAFMLSGRADVKIDVLHIRPRFQDYCEITLEEETVQDAQAALNDDDAVCMDDFYRQALEILDKNGISKDRMDLQTLDGSLSIPRAILKYAQDGQFGTLVMGRRGRSKSVFTGSVSRSLLQKAGNSALWVVP